MTALVEKHAWIEPKYLWLSILRIAIGWHFIWEGIIKLSQSSWSAEGYLTHSWGPFAPVFQGIATVTVADTPGLSWLFGAEYQSTLWMLETANLVMPWALFLAGLGLLLGVFTRQAVGLAIGLLALFILANPAYEFIPTAAGEQWDAYFGSLQSAQWAGNSPTKSEGNYFIVSKNLIELIALSLLLAFDTKRLIGLDAVFETVGQSEPADAPTLATNVNVSSPSQ